MRILRVVLAACAASAIIGCGAGEVYSPPSVIGKPPVDTGHVKPDSNPVPVVNPTIDTLGARGMEWARPAGKATPLDSLPWTGMTIEEAVAAAKINVIVSGVGADFSYNTNTARLPTNFIGAKPQVILEILSHELGHKFVGPHDCGWDATYGTFIKDCKWGTGAYTVEVRYERFLANHAHVLGLSPDDSNNVLARARGVLANWIVDVPADVTRAFAP